MKKLQMPVLVIAGGLTALLWGLSDVMDKNVVRQTASQNGLSAARQAEIGRKIRLQGILAGREPQEEHYDLQVARYAAMQDEAAAAGLTVTDDELRDFIVEQFGGDQGYRQFLSQLGHQGVSTGLMESYLQDAVAFGKLMQLRRLGVYVTAGELRAALRESLDRVDYDLFSIATDKIVLSTPVGDADRRAWFDTHAGDAEFQMPERARLEVLFVDSGVMATSEPGEADLRRHYDDNRRRYQSREFPGEAQPYFEVKDRVHKEVVDGQRRSLAKGLLDELDATLLEQDNQDLKGALEQARKADPRFAAVTFSAAGPVGAKDYSVKPLGYVFDLSQKLFGKDKEKRRSYGGVFESRPETGQYGYYLYKVVEWLPARGMELAECADTVTRRLERERRQEAAKALSRQWEPRLAATTDWGTLDLAKDPALSWRLEKDASLDSPEAKTAGTLAPGVLSKEVETAVGLAFVRLVRRVEAGEDEMKEQEDAVRRRLESAKMSLLAGPAGP